MSTSAHRSLLRVPTDRRKGYDFDFFLAHIWGDDEQGRNNHDRVVVLGNALNARGFRAWFDQDQLQAVGPGIHHDMTKGIDSSTVFVVCISRNYIRQVRDGRPDGAMANCRFEFGYAMQRIETERKISVVMEEWCKDTKDWSGPVGAVMGSKLYIDFMEDSNLDIVVQRLSDALKQIIPSSTREDNSKIPSLLPASIAPRIINNGEIVRLHLENGRVVKGIMRLPQPENTASFLPTGSKLSITSKSALLFSFPRAAT